MEFLKNLFGSKPKVDWDEVKKSLDPKIANLKRPAVRLVKTTQTKRSKFGGLPFANMSSFEWPGSNGKPIAFLAQLDLAEISRVHKYDWLGSEGLLLFFYDVAEMPWGFDPKDRGKWSVIYQSNPDSFINYPEDLDNEFRIEESYIQSKLIEVLPNYDDPSVENLGLTDAEIDAYIDMNEGDDEPSHQVGGFPSPIQGNYMDLDSQLASNGVYIGNPEGYECDEAKKLEAGAKDWKLLLQFDSDDDLDVMWGDCGMIYFWVQEQKAMKNQFDNSWLILQCC